MAHSPVSHSPISRNRKGADTLNLQTRRAAAGVVFTIGVLVLLLAMLCSPALRAGCILLGLILALPALLGLAVDFMLQRAVRAVQELQIKTD